MEIHIKTVSIHKNDNYSVIFAPTSFKFCVVVDLEVTDKFRKKNPKRLWHLGGVAVVVDIEVMDKLGKYFKKEFSI